MQDENPNDAILPNERESIDDCHFRYYEYGKTGAIKPTYGRPTYLREFAHMAAIGWTQPDNLTILWQCGGSLIWENFILTAAHCTADANNTQPDVARFGDLNLFDDSDDQYAQQLKIIEVIRHPQHRFSARYHDIALMRLERRIELHDTVAPACLWTDDEIRFKAFEATGWGATGFAESRTPILLKVSLTPVERESCTSHYSGIRGLRSGLHEYQMCAGDSKMDTCPGDSGGPLQVKLLHNTRLTPFIVGVTSFGTACGFSVPGVYSRVAPYVPWIQTVLRASGEDAQDWQFEPHACALRYVHLREYEPSVVLHSSGENEQLDLDEAHLFGTSSAQVVSIHWNETVAPGNRECYGVIIDRSTVVTLARCTQANGVPPSHVTHLGNDSNIVTRHHRHPDYREHSLLNDVGILELKDPFEFASSWDFYPACIWSRKNGMDGKLTVSGRGLRALNEIVEKEPEINNSTLKKTINTVGVVVTQNGTNCTIPRQYATKLPNGLSAEHLCFGAEPFLVPKTCDLAYGGPLQREVFRWGRRLMYVNALSLLGKDCGFGESAVAVKLSHHVEWLQSVLLPPRTIEKAAETRPFVFLNPDLEEGDECSTQDRSAGVCVNAQYCPKVAQGFRQNRGVTFCQSGSLVCCPHRYIRNGTNEEWQEIDRCNVDHQGGEEDMDEAPLHMVSIVWTYPEWNRVCAGTIISSRTLVTAASCLDMTKPPSYVHVNHPDAEIELRLEPGSVTIHPEFENSTKRHDIALIRTRSVIDGHFGRSRACLWRNTTHTPFLLQQYVYLNDAVETTEAFFKFNTDCRRAFGRVPQAHELCLHVDDPDHTFFVDEGMPALWTKPGASQASYLIGIASHRSTVERSVFIHTRVSSYIDWIKGEL
ncbi:uncharacterized protein LOC131211796 isoform X1 [Anopheles bellator]|uniref:uncharacterized protein LOC131211796 isoform X1 n=1 Tax=Anopheles bellator TaxID=139047 RepID=UPI00264A307A|nr:uncharacterized protein LOC131211796 isoform X1 [Anopheles bellator]